MKILLLKHCSNIRFGQGKEANGGQTEIMVTIDLLKKAGHRVGVVTIAKYHEEAIKSGVDAIDWSALKEAAPLYDLVLMFNGVFNCYGGAISEESLASYHLLNSFRGPIIYAVTDTAIPIGDCYGWIKGAQAKGKYLELAAENYRFDPKRIYCLTQTYALDCLPKLWDESTNAFGAYSYFPFETTVFFRRGLKSDIFENPTTDLIYFGNPRGGKRDKKVHKFYCNHQGLVVDMYGNWKREHFEKMHKKSHISSMPTLLGKCEMYELHGKINESLAHCYISDKANEGTIWTTRFYEAILNRSILFVDIDNDPKMSRFKDPFFYVKDGDELVSKIWMLKNDPQLRRQKLADQYVAMSTILKTIPHYVTILDNNLHKAKELYASSL